MIPRRDGQHLGRRPEAADPRSGSARKAEVDRLRRAQVERAREEAELAQRQFMLVRPEHRLVADSLEQQWNAKLARLAEVEEEYRRTATADGHEVAAAERAHIHGLASDLPRVWHDPRTPMRERKRMLRLLIEDVTLRRDSAIQIQIRWKGGATTTLARPLPLAAYDLRRTPSAIIEMIRALATEQTDRQIAETLNGRSLRSGTGKAFTRLLVRTLREAYAIPRLADHARRNPGVIGGEPTSTGAGHRVCLGSGGAAQVRPRVRHT